MTRSANAIPLAIDELEHIDELLEHRVRLAVCVLLSRHDAFSFSRLKVVLRETDGNLGAHLRKLENAGYLTVERTYQERRPATWYRLSAKGRAQLSKHLESLARLIDRGSATAGAVKKRSGR
jgi:predicted ArsR family transcriptional regulator